ncbi:MAG TPA: DUF5011 domain-containing protein [Chitinophagaceae bacterium]|nr:DUF5011 domain-containing protein [Chitinophagaceae bacterium]
MRIIKLFLSVVAIFSIISCEKTEEINNTEDKIGISRVTRFPTFTMEGDRYISIVKGESFTDPGATAKEGTADLPVTISGAVDASTAGVYDLVYSATNKDGFSSSVTRTVAVLPVAEQAGVNIAGSYANIGAFTYTATIQKLAPGFYLVDNIWGGGSAAIISAYIITTDGENWTLPVSTLTGYGRVQGTATLNAAGDLTYIVSLLDLGINNSTRKWKKV